MRTVVSPLIDNLNNTNDRIPRIANRIIIENAEIILEIIKENQLSYGKDSNDNVVGYYKSITSLYAYNDRMAYGYPKSSKSKGQPYDFQWSGELFNTLNLRGDVSKQEYTIFSSTGKLSLLEDIYKTKLGDLTDKNNDWINENILLPNLYKIILDEMILGF